MKIVVLVKGVPPVGTERLGADGRIERTTLEPNGADEYVLERALQLAESAGAEVSLLTMGPESATDALRKGLAMGASSAVRVGDPRLAGTDLRGTVAVLAAALRRIGPDLILAGTDSSDGGAGVAGPAIAARLGLPCLVNASAIEVAAGSVTIRRPVAGGLETLRAPLPALVVGTQLLGEPRYPSLRGIMAARSRTIETWSLADLGLDAPAVSTIVTGSTVPPPRAGAEIVRGDAGAVADRILAFLDARGLP